MLARAAVLLAVAIPLAWFFGRAICTDEMFGYRDAAHYYYPYYWYVHEHWTHGILPLWNPLENLGQPLAADPTAAAFYPGKLLFFLPLPYDWLYKVYIVGHVALCAAGAYWLARQWQASRPAAGLAAVAYAFGGPVVFQYANIVFLVGAAWLPLALWGAHRLVVKREWWGVLAFAFAAAMIILGGDPEAAYLAALVTLLLAFLEWRRQATVGRAVSPSEGREEPESTSEPPPDSGRANSPSYVASMPLLIAAAFALAFALSAIQLIPSIVWGQKTERALFDSPRSLWEIPSYLARPSAPEDPPLAGEPPAESVTWYRDLIGQPQAGTHHADAYGFSVGPWRFVELLWPNFYGREFPENRRWGSVIPQEDSPWTPSLYIGLIPFLLLLTQLTFLSGPLRSRWLTWTMLILVLGSLGCFGIVWAIREVIYLCSGSAVEMPLGEGVGGVYWFFTVALPGFVQFRYPAKLLVLATLCAALLAARGLDRIQGRLGVLTALSLVVVLISGHLLLMIHVFPVAFNAAIADAPPSSVFGPVDAPGAFFELVASLAQTLSVGLVFAAITAFARRTCLERETSGWLVMEASLLLIVACDLGFAHSWGCITLPRTIWAHAQTFSDQPPVFHPSPARYHAPQFYRWPQEQDTYVRDFSPWTWTDTGSPDRLAEVVKYEMAGRHPKYNLLLGIRVHPSPGSSSYSEFTARWLGWPHFARDDWQRQLVAGDFFSRQPVPVEFDWFEPMSERIGASSRAIVLPALHRHSWQALQKRAARVIDLASVADFKAYYRSVDRVVIESDDAESPPPGNVYGRSPSLSRA